MRGAGKGYESWLLPAGALLTYVTLAFLPAALHPLLYNLSAALTGVALVLYALWARRVRGWAAIVAIAGALPLVTLAISSALAVSPGISFVGALGQHSGWLLYAAMYMWAVAGMSLASPVALRRLTITGACLGAVMATTALLERVGVISWGLRYSPDPSGMLDNPTSLGQTLVIALGCSVAWWLTARRRSQKVTAAACGILSVAGLALSGVLGTALSAVLGAAVALVLWGVRPHSRRGAIIATAVVMTLLALVVVTAWGLSRPGIPLETAEQLSSLSNRRTEIWASTFAIAAQAPLLGRGPDQFGVWQSWTATPSGDLGGSTTLDAHDALLALLVSGGVVGLLAGLVAIGSIVLGVLSAHAERRLPPAALAVVGGVAGWGLSTLVAWVYLPAATLSLALIGCVIALASGSSDAAPAPPRWTTSAAPWVAGALAAITAGVLAWAMVVPAPLEASYTWTTRLGKERGFPHAEARHNYESWPDPEYATVALDGQFARIIADESGAAADAAQVVALTTGSAGYDSRTAFARIKVLQAISATAGSDDYPAIVAAASLGRRADPLAGFWDYALTLEALRLGKRQSASAAAERALGFRQSGSNRAWLEDVQAGKAGLVLPEE